LFPIYSNMPVTTRAAPVEVKRAPVSVSQTPSTLLKSACGGLVKEGDELWLSAFEDETPIHPERNGFVSTVLDAYLQHNHLVLRPEDVWFAILIQLSFYVNKHAEKLRKYFVDHAGKRKLQILQDEFDFKDFCAKMADLIAENVKDPALRDWIMPSFSTTTDEDKVTAAIIMMGTMQKYFAYFCGITCGIPSVTLLGERADWQEILNRLPFLSKFGLEHDELALWNSVLTAVLSKFVDTFDAPDSPEVVRFWQGSVHQYTDDYSGEKLITGWIQAFCFWNADGAPLVARRVLQMTEHWRKAVKDNGLNYWLDGVRMGRMNWNDIPAGYAHVPVHIKLNSSAKFMTKAIAGSVGWRVVDSEAIFKQTRGPNKPKPTIASSRQKGEQPDRGILNFARAARRAPSQYTETTLVPPEPASQALPIRKHNVFATMAQKVLCCSSNSDEDTLADKRTATKVSDLLRKIDDWTPLSAFGSSSQPSTVQAPQIYRNGQYDEDIAEWELRRAAEIAPQISDLSELGQPWEYEAGGEHDMLQPVTGWWLAQTKAGKYGRDEDCPDVQFDSDAEDYDEYLAMNGRPLEVEEYR
jgi:hypothetical protein